MKETMATELDQLAESLHHGTPLSLMQVRALAQAQDPLGLGMLAADARTRRLGTRGTFVRVEAIETSALPSGTPPEVPADAGEVRLTGTPSSIEEAVAAVGTVRASTAVTLSGWALDALAALGPDLPATLAALRAAGLDAVATARVDRTDLAQLQAVADAGLALQSLTLGTPLEGEPLVDVLMRVRDWQARTGVVRAFVPLPVDVPADQPTTGFDDMRHVALARLALDTVDHIQAHWTRHGAKLAQACLLFGADDVDGVPARDALPHGPRRAIVEEVRRNLVAASLDPVERDGAFRPRDGSAA